MGTFNMLGMIGLGCIAFVTTLKMYQTALCWKMKYCLRALLFYEPRHAERTTRDRLRAPSDRKYDAKEREEIVLSQNVPGDKWENSNVKAKHMSYNIKCGFSQFMVAHIAENEYSCPMFSRSGGNVTGPFGRNSENEASKKCYKQHVKLFYDYSFHPSHTVDHFAGGASQLCNMFNIFVLALLFYSLQNLFYFYIGFLWQETQWKT